MFNNILYYNISESSDHVSDGGSKAVQTMHRVDRFSRKLQRRLTRRTMAEAKAIKEQIHVIIYVAELVNYKITNRNFET